MRYTAISRKVVQKSARDNPERHCVLCFARLKSETSFNFLVTRFMTEMSVLPFTLLSSPPLMFSPWKPLEFWSPLALALSLLSTLM